MKLLHIHFVHVHEIKEACRKIYILGELAPVHPVYLVMVFTTCSVAIIISETTLVWLMLTI